MGIFRIMPVAIFNQNLISEIIHQHSNSLLLPFIVLGLISLNFFMQWVFNIWLFTTNIETYNPTDNLKQKRKYVWSFLFASFQATLPLIRDIFEESLIPGGPPAGFALYPIIGSLANNAVILLIIHLRLTRKNETRLAVQNMKLEVNNLLAQQAQLKHQLQPHFLFNALYTLQLLIKKQPDLAQKYLQQLSTFLRSSLQYSERDTILTRDELAFCEGYLALQKVRFHTALHYHIDIDQDLLENSRVPIFTLQLLAENAIKHNAFSAASPLKIRIISVFGEQILVENNTIPKTPKAVNSSGIGLKNLCERFQLLGYQSPLIEHEMEKQYFRVYLPTLPL